jgi:hypothetical protein
MGGNPHGPAHIDGPSKELDDFLRNSRTGGPMHNYDARKALCSGS